MKQRLFIGLFILYCATLSLTQLRASLQWEQTSTTRDLDPTQSSLDVEYRFKNTGPYSLAIISVDSSCLCVTTNQIKGEYKPGEGGILKAKYKPANRIGKFIETIAIRTTDTKNPVTHLRLVVTIPSLFRMEPGYLTWTKGVPPEPLEIFFYDLTQKGIKPTTVYSPSTNFSAILQHQPEQKRYAIKVTPADTNAEDLSSIYVDIDLGGGLIKKTKIVVVIKDPSSKAPPTPR